jgi:hypothetical protein
MRKQPVFKKLKIGMVARNMNEYLNGKPEEIESVWEFSICDMRRGVHICSFQSNAEMFRVGYDFTTTKEFDALQESDPDKWESRREQLFDWIQELHSCDDSDCFYIDWSDLSPSRLRGVSKHNIQWMKPPKGKLMMICRDFDTTDMKDHLEEARDKLGAEASADDVWDKAYVAAMEEEIEYLHGNSSIS